MRNRTLIAADNKLQIDAQVDENIVTDILKRKYTDDFRFAKERKFF